MAAYQRQTWQDGNPAYAVTAARMAYIEDGIHEVSANGRTAVVAEAPLNVEYPEFGAGPSKTAAQNATAIQAAINALPAAGGGEVLLPNSYDYSTSLNLVARHGVHLKGVAGRRNPVQPPRSRLRYTGATGNAINAATSHGTIIEDLTVEHSASAGTVLDCAASTGDNPTTFVRVNRCWIVGAAVGTGIDFKLVINAAVRDSVIENLAYGVKGSVANPEVSYSNDVTLDNVTWGTITTMSVLNPGQQWTLIKPTFQALANGSSVALEANFRHEDLVIIGAGLWDATAGGTWLKLRGTGTVIMGGLAGGHPTTRVVDAQHVDNNGLTVCGMTMRGTSTSAIGIGVDLDTGKPNTRVFGNRYDFVTTKVNATSEPYAATSGVFSRDESGEISGLGLYPISTYARAFPGGMVFTDAITAAQAPNNSIFRDSADNVLKQKNNAGVVSAL